MNINSTEAPEITVEKIDYYSVLFVSIFGLIFFLQTYPMFAIYILHIYFQGLGVYLLGGFGYLWVLVGCVCVCVVSVLVWGFCVCVWGGVGC